MLGDNSRTEGVATRRPDQTKKQQSAPSSGTQFQQAKHGGTTTANRGQTTTPARVAVAAALTEGVEEKREEGRHVEIWLPCEEEQPVPMPAADGEATLRIVNRVSLAEQMNSGKGTVDI